MVSYLHVSFILLMLTEMNQTVGKFITETLLTFTSDTVWSTILTHHGTNWMSPTCILTTLSTLVSHPRTTSSAPLSKRSSTCTVTSCPLPPTISGETRCQRERGVTPRRAQRCFLASTSLLTPISRNTLLSRSEQTHIIHSCYFSRMSFKSSFYFLGCRVSSF